MLRELQLGQQVYQAGELFTAYQASRDDLLRDLFGAKWTDPILGCMAYYAAIDESRTDSGREWMPELQRIAAENLLKYFGKLPDARLVAGIELGKEDLVKALLRGNEVPVLARSVRELARREQEMTSWIRFSAREQGRWARFAARVTRALGQRKQRNSPIAHLAARLDRATPFTTLYTAPARVMAEATHSGEDRWMS